MRTQNFRRASHQVIDTVEDRRKTLGVRLAEVIGRMTMHDGVRQVHAGPAA